MINNAKIKKRAVSVTGARLKLTSLTVNLMAKAEKTRVSAMLNRLTTSGWVKTVLTVR